LGNLEALFYLELNFNYLTITILIGIRDLNAIIKFSNIHYNFQALLRF